MAGGARGRGTCHGRKPPRGCLCMALWYTCYTRGTLDTAGARLRCAAAELGRLRDGTFGLP
eukprot:scaffold13529_cov101-Isochrysis_galbana.AAC.6